MTIAAINQVIQSRIEQSTGTHLFTIISACHYEVRIIFSQDGKFVVETLSEGEFVDDYTRVHPTIDEALAKASLCIAECFKE